MMAHGRKNVFSCGWSDLRRGGAVPPGADFHGVGRYHRALVDTDVESEEHTSELQSLRHLVCRLLLLLRPSSRPPPPAPSFPLSLVAPPPASLGLFFVFCWGWGVCGRKIFFFVGGVFFGGGGFLPPGVFFLGGGLFPGAEGKPVF